MFYRLKLNIFKLPNYFVNRNKMFWRRLTNGNEKLMQQQLTGNSDSNSLGGGTDTGTYEDILQKQYVPRLCVPLEIAQYFVVRFLQCGSPKLNASAANIQFPSRPTSVT